MAITFIAGTHYSVDSASGVNLACPAGSTINDLMICLVTYTYAYPSSVSSGWISLGQIQITSTYCEAFYKIASASNANFICSFTSTGGRCGASIITYRGGFDYLDPIDSVNLTGITAYSTALIAPSIDVTKVNSSIIHFGSVFSSKSRTFAKPTQLDNNWSEDYDYGTTNGDRWHNFNSCEWSSNGSTGNVNSTISSTSNNKVAYLLALNPLRRLRMYITHV